MTSSLSVPFTKGMITDVLKEYTLSFGNTTSQVQTDMTVFLLARNMAILKTTLDDCIEASITSTPTTPAQENSMFGEHHTFILENNEDPASLLEKDGPYQMTPEYIEHVLLLRLVEYLDLVLHYTKTNPTPSGRSLMIYSYKRPIIFIQGMIPAAPYRVELLDVKRNILATIQPIVHSEVGTISLGIVKEEIVDLRRSQEVSPIETFVDKVGKGTFAVITVGVAILFTYMLHASPIWDRRG